MTVAHGESGADIAATVTPFKRRDLADKIEQATQVLVLQDPVEWRKKAMPLAAALIDPIAATAPRSRSHRGGARRRAVEGAV